MAPRTGRTRRWAGQSNSSYQQTCLLKAHHMSDTVISALQILNHSILFGRNIFIPTLLIGKPRPE